jgi:hypothetical protein
VFAEIPCGRSAFLPTHHSLVMEVFGAELLPLLVVDKGSRAGHELGDITYVS